jgi:hypothetical protein
VRFASSGIDAQGSLFNLVFKVRSPLTWGAPNAVA